MDAAAIRFGLAAWGVTIFENRPPPETPAPDPAALIRACIESGDPHYKSSVVALLLVLDERQSRPALERLSRELTGYAGRWLRWLALGAHYLSHVYRTQLAFLLGRAPGVPANVFDRGPLPSPEDDFGLEGLRALAEEIASIEAPAVNWFGTLEGPARELIHRLWFERWRRLATAG